MPVRGRFLWSLKTPDAQVTSLNQRAVKAKPLRGECRWYVICPVELTRDLSGLQNGGEAGL
jgi:hypothetical protein